MKKILFWIDNTYVNFFLAKKIQDSLSAESLHAIYEISDKPTSYFRNQKFVNFQSSYFYFDEFNDLKSEPDMEYLQSKENEYKINFMKLLLTDRHLYNFNDFYNFSEKEVLRILEIEIKFYESILKNIKPDYVILTHVFLRNRYLFYLICKHHGIQILIPIPIRLANRCIISDDYNNFGYNQSENKNISEDLELEKIREKFDLKNTTKDISNRFLQSKKDLIKASSNFLLSPNSNVKSNYTHFGRNKINILQNYLIDNIRTRIRKNFIDKNFDKEIPQNLKFIYFPLHVEQEHTLLIYAPFYTNQLEFLKNVSKSLPINYKLIVKEHPGMYTRSWHSISFYKEIMKLPNTILFHPDSDSNELLKKCDLTISIRGSTSFEAGYYNKPAIECVPTDYGFLPHIFKLQNIDELTDLIRKSLNQSFDNSEFVKYLNFLEKNSFEYEPDGLAQDVSDFFSYGGYLVNVEISQQKIDDFYKQINSKIDLLSEQIIKKI